MLNKSGYRCFAVLVLAAGSVCAQKAPPTVAQSIKGLFDGVNRQLLDMAKDFPADKYGYRMKPEMRTFGEVIVHAASGNVFASKVGRGEKVKWDELDPKNYKSKDEIVALLQKSIEDADATLSANPDGYNKDINPWLGVAEHSAEHYGLLVAYYRANGMVPPESRPKPKN
jgi:hypothetical protein